MWQNRSIVTLGIQWRDVHEIVEKAEEIEDSFKFESYEIWAIRATRVTIANSINLNQPIHRKYVHPSIMSVAIPLSFKQ